eukprot:CAMPEP_0181177284 /NCGR_PEP_ID=MMETSP1096-20121128/5081_1 /TAXON_ID=156174 ORGANISM="Chrysochromulina ericina, Strain CCMP281" /NCGR_SAMPLE_ID=MMETSP1096 /ASSEMBLY_ACC=CAM_ASM_000453 /LENGTH=58 /DNA_ID=CAMNT_0023265429 /DNA_START=624 /DNA_END=800 /DNA_ORIENTATION=+
MLAHRDAAPTRNGMVLGASKRELMPLIQQRGVTRGIRQPCGGKQPLVQIGKELSESMI